MYTGGARRANKAEPSLCFNSPGSADRGRNALRNIVLLLLCVRVSKGGGIGVYVVYKTLFGVSFSFLKGDHVMPPGVSVISRVSKT